MIARRRIGFVTGLAAEAAWLRGHGFPVEVGGGDPAGAAAAAESLLAGGAEALISFGLAGGLAPALAAGALVVPERVVTDRARYACDPALVAWLGGANAASVYGGGGIIAAKAEKAALFSATGAVAADVESGVVAEAASRAGLPMAVLRAVSDAAGTALPPAALGTIDRRGRVVFRRVLAELIRRPGQIPALLDIAAGAGRARRTLRAQLRGLS